MRKFIFWLTKVLLGCGKCACGGTITHSHSEPINDGYTYVEVYECGECNRQYV